MSAMHFLFILSLHLVAMPLGIAFDEAEHKELSGLCRQTMNRCAPKYANGAINHTSRGTGPLKQLGRSCDAWMDQAWGTPVPGKSIFSPGTFIPSNVAKARTKLSECARENSAGPAFQSAQAQEAALLLRRWLVQEPQSLMQDLATLRGKDDDCAETKGKLGLSLYTYSLEKKQEIQALETACKANLVAP